MIWKCKNVVSVFGSICLTLARQWRQNNCENVNCLGRSATIWFQWKVFTIESNTIFLAYQLLLIFINAHTPSPIAWIHLTEIVTVFFISIRAILGIRNWNNTKTKPFANNNNRKYDKRNQINSNWQTTRLWLWLKRNEDEFFFLFFFFKETVRWA